MTATTQSAERMPPGIPFIIANELAERFCYYGINSILTVYMVQHLHFGDAKATIWQSLFKFGAYFFPFFAAILADVFWGKFKTIMFLALFYCAGCAVVALVSGPSALAAGLFLTAFGTGIKSCVSTNVGDQFTEKNQHLISKAFSYFYFSINLGSSVSIFMCPIWLETYGPKVAFGIPAAMMLLATAVFWAGRKRFTVIPPAMKQRQNRGALMFALCFAPVLGITMWVWQATNSTAYAVLALLGQMALVIWLCLKTGLRKALPPELVGWLEQSFTGDALKLVLKLAFIYYIFIAIFWSLWEQSNGQTWTLQATSDLMDKHIFAFLQGVPLLGALSGYEMLPAQLTVVNGLFILLMIPIFTFGIFPLWQRLFRITALRKICVGLFVIAASFGIIAWIENRIVHGHVVSAWWQILAYGVLSASEVLISITALEFAYSQAPLKMKSFMMAAMYLFSVSVGQAFTVQVNTSMIKPLAASAVQSGAETWVSLPDVSGMQTGQKIDFAGDTGLTVSGDDGKPAELAGTFLISEIDTSGSRVKLMDVVHRQPLASTGEYKAATAKVTTYRLVGADYFLFFAGAAALAGFLFIFVIGLYREKIHVRQDDTVAGEAA
ncbi:POT-type proton-dependent oligopeptide transporter [Nevskia soli]|uniref:POT-type proton-dependent oligopeptide transporter n=1 Tax=Nevskia soli TaxID=418856 RepID=UPI0004A6B2BC|nr:MFS transporter [Nevskia soli]